MRLLAQNATATKYVQLTDAVIANPSLNVNGYYLPMTQAPLSGLKLQATINGAVYRAMEYTTTSASAAYYTSSVAPGNMSYVTALTTSYITNTIPQTVVSTTNTVYATYYSHHNGGTYNAKSQILYDFYTLTSTFEGLTRQGITFMTGLYGSFAHGVAAYNYPSQGDVNLGYLETYNSLYHPLSNNYLGYTATSFQYISNYRQGTSGTFTYESYSGYNKPIGEVLQASYVNGSLPWDNSPVPYQVNGNVASYVGYSSAVNGVSSLYTKAWYMETLDPYYVPSYETAIVTTGYVYESVTYTTGYSGISSSSSSANTWI